MKEETQEFIQSTLAAMGWKQFRPMKGTLLVRTRAVPEKTSGGIYLPAKIASFFGELPNLQPVVATVIAAGKLTTVQVGEDVAFMRLNFTWLKQMEDNSYVGLIAEANLLGEAEGEGTLGVLY